MKHAAKRVRGGQAARAPRARSHAPVFLFSAAATGAALFCAPQFSAFAQTGAANPPVSSAPLKLGDSAIKTTFSAADDAPTSFANVIPSDPNTPIARSLPLSRIREDKAGNATATQLVNLITYAALAPDGTPPAPDQPLWLGTQYGVKRVQNQTVRYYTSDDGLPGAYVEAVASSADAKTREAWCLVRPKPAIQSSSAAYNQTAQQLGKAGRLAFCQWDSQTDTWRTAAEIVVPGSLSSLNRNGGDNREQDWRASRALLRWEGKAKIAQSGRFVAFAASVTAQDADALVYLWDKKSQKLRPLGWEPGLKNAAVPFVGVSFLHIDEARQTLWVGTSQGLYARPLDEKGKWRAYLAGRTVSAGASGRDKNALYITCRLPGAIEETFDPSRRLPVAPPPTPGQRPAPVVPDWQLLRVALSNGEATELPTPLSLSGPEPGGFSYGSPQPTTPTGLFVDADKVVWVTLSEKTSPYDDYYSFGSSSGDKRPSTIEHFDTATKTWERISLSGRSQFYSYGGQGAGHIPRLPGSAGAAASPQDSPTPEARLKELDAIPSGALVPLALTYQSTAPSQTNSGLISLQRGGFPFYTLPPEFWIEHRFPHWYGASDEKSRAALAPVYRYLIPDINPSGGADTAPDALLWMTYQDRLAFLRRADAIDSGIGQFGYDAAHLTTIPLEATFTGLQTPLLRIVASSAQTPSLLIGQARSNFYLIDTETNSWQDAAPTDTRNGGSSMELYYSALLSSANGAPFMQRQRGVSEPIRKWNSDKRWESQPNVPIPEGGLLLGSGVNGAVWFSSNMSTESLWYQEPAPPSGLPAPAPVRVQPPLPTEWRVPGAPRPYEITTATRPIAARGSRAYFIVPVRGDFFHAPASTGEDDGQIDPNDGNTATIDGGRLPASSSRNSLVGYDIVTKKWTAPLPLTRDSQNQPNLLFLGDQTYAATTAGNGNGTVWQWNETKNSWDVIAPPLPPEPGLFEQDEKPLARAVVPVAVTERYVWVFIVARMMARYDRASDKWETISLPAALRGPNEENFYEQGRYGGRVVAMGKDRFCISSDKGGLWVLRVLPGAAKNKRLNAAWERLGQSRTVRSQPIDPPVAPPAPGSAAPASTPRVVSPPRQAEFSLSNLTVTPRFVWMSGNGSGGSDSLPFVARWNKVEKTWTTWGGNSSLPPQSYINSLIADGDSVWLSGQNGTYHYDENANRWDTIALPDERYSRSGLRGAPIKGQVSRIVPDADGAYLLLYYPTPDTQGVLLWRWNRADGALRPLPFPESEARASAGGGAVAPIYWRGNTLLDEPGVLWVGTNNGLWAWDKKAQTWSKPALPAFVSEIAPNQIARSENALVLFGPPIGSNDRGIQQAVRLTALPFLKRP